MNPRNRRAIGVLVIWAIGIGVWQLGSAWWDRQKMFRVKRASTQTLTAKERAIRVEFSMIQSKRMGLMQSNRPAWLGIPEDQLRLRIQDSMLRVAQQAGLQEVRLRALPVVDRPPAWRIEGAGTLAQWLDFLEGVPKQALPVGLRRVKWAVTGDPWLLQGADGQGGPPIKGEAEWEGAILNFAEPVQ